MTGERISSLWCKSNHCLPLITDLSGGCNYIHQDWSLEEILQQECANEHFRNFFKKIDIIWSFLSWICSRYILVCNFKLIFSACFTITIGREWDNWLLFCLNGMWNMISRHRVLYAPTQHWSEVCIWNLIMRGHFHFCFVSIMLLNIPVSNGNICHSVGR